MIQNGLEMNLGALPKDRDPAEDKYTATRTMSPPAVNLNEDVSLLKYAPADILNQGGQGACAQFAVAECDFITRNAARAGARQSMNAELAHSGFLYEQARRLHGWFPSDSGSWPSDGFDMLLRDKPLLSRAPYVGSAAFDYEDALFINKTPIDDLMSHRAFFVNEGDALERLKDCLDRGWAVSICMYWHPTFYNPPNGILPENAGAGPQYGAHAMTVRGRFVNWTRPAGVTLSGGIAAVLNHWSAGWNSIVTNLGGDFRPGEVAIPDSFFMPGRNSPIFELRAASPEPVEIGPEPDPEPPPDPNFHSFLGRVIKVKPGKLSIVPDNFTINIKGRRVSGVTIDDTVLSFSGKVKTASEDLIVLKGEFEASLEMRRVQVQTI
jgi:hypothetical protein